MGKNAKERIDDTLNYIKNTGLVRHEMRRDAYKLAKRYIQTKFPVVNKAYATFSEGMSTDGVKGRGNAEMRKMRRAIHLLWHAMDAGKLQGSRAKTLPVPHLTSEMQRTLFKAAVHFEIKEGATYWRRDLLTNVLPDNGLSWLGEYVLKVGGSPRNKPDGQGRNLLDFYLTYDASSDRFQISPVGGGAPAGAYTFRAVSVPAVHWASVPGRGNALSPAPGAGASFADIKGTCLDGADIMITTQFTGCSFCLKGGGAVYAAHISPDGPGQAPGLSGQVLARQLAGLTPGVGAGDFSNHTPGHGAFKVYGRQHSNIAGYSGGYPDTHTISAMYLIGFNLDDGWRIYSQHLGATQKIAGAYRIL